MFGFSARYRALSYPRADRTALSQYHRRHHQRPRPLSVRPPSLNPAIIEQRGHKASQQLVHPGTKLHRFLSIQCLRCFYEIAILGHGPASEHAPGMRLAAAGPSESRALPCENLDQPIPEQHLQHQCA